MSDERKTTDGEKVDHGKAALRWWSNLQPADDGSRPGDTAALARLRRATTPLEALAAAPEEVVRLAKALDQTRRSERVAELAATLAHVRTHAWSPRMAAALGAKPAKESPRLMSEIRFRRLLQADTAEERMAAFRRAVHILGNTTNVADLAESLLDWSHRTFGEQRRIRWLFDYVGETPPPSDDETESPNSEKETAP